MTAATPCATWRLWAHQYEDGALFNVGPRPYVELHGLSYPVVPVEVVEVPAEAPDGTHWGWLWGGRENWCGGAPCMIWPSWGLFSMCFPYGVRADEAAGNGRSVRLRVSVVAPDDETAATAGEEQQR